MPRQELFDINRRIDPTMATAEEVEALRVVIQQMQQQHAEEIATLRQQLDQPNRNGLFELTPDQIINKFQHIKTFYGNDDYPLQEFINAVENIARLCNNNEALLRHGLLMICKEKIQGEAKMYIQRLPDNATWDMVKNELKTHFRPRKSYRKLMDESRNIKVNSLRELFDIVRSINYQLNELYEFDDNKPTNYNPDNNDKNLVDIIKDMITDSYRSNIERNMNLIQVYNTFDNLNLLDEIDVIHYKYRKNHKEMKVNNNVPRKEFKREKQENNFNNRNNNINNYSGQYRHFNHAQNERQFRNNYNNNSGQIRNNYNNNPRQFRNNDNNNSGQFRQRQPNFYGSLEPMEIDNVQEQDINFTNEPRTENYQ